MVNYITLLPEASNTVWKQASPTPISQLPDQMDTWHSHKAADCTHSWFVELKEHNTGDAVFFVLNFSEQPTADLEATGFVCCTCYLSTFWVCCIHYKIMHL